MIFFFFPQAVIRDNVISEFWRAFFSFSLSPWMLVDSKLVYIYIYIYIYLKKIEKENNYSFDEFIMKIDVKRFRCNNLLQDFKFKISFVKVSIDVWCLIHCYFNNSCYLSNVKLLRLSHYFASGKRCKLIHFPSAVWNANGLILDFNSGRRVHFTHTHTHTHIYIYIYIYIYTWRKVYQIIQSVVKVTMHGWCLIKYSSLL